VTSLSPSPEKIRAGEGRAKNTQTPSTISGKGKHTDADTDVREGASTGAHCCRHQTRWGKTRRKIFAGNLLLETNVYLSTYFPKH